MNKKIIIFDLDGTLLNTLEDLTDSVNYMLSQFDYPSKNIEQIKNYVGNGVYKLIERAVPEGKLNKNFDKCVEIFKNRYKENMYNKTSLYQGIEQMLKKLKQKGFIIAVASNKFDLAVKELCNKYFSNLIDCAFGENEKAGIKKKPSPDIVLNILTKYNLLPEQALYVGDSEVDIQTAKNSGIECISVCWGFKTKEFLNQNEATNIIDTPEEIFNFI
jgi:phosphoglycolate phosphatase